MSQVATTTYNAAYFAGMTDVTHKPHSFYISRYPPGREATVGVSGPLDLKWRNDTRRRGRPDRLDPVDAHRPGLGHQAIRRDLDPRPADQPHAADAVKIPAGAADARQPGAPGSTITDTRTLRDLKTGQVRTERRTTKYNPSPIVSSAPADPRAAPARPDEGRVFPSTAAAP